MKNKFFKLSLILIFIIWFIYLATPWSYFGLNNIEQTTPYRLGLDLSWGIELDYKVDLDEARKDENFTKKEENNTVESLKKIVDKRISNLNINDSVITTSSYWDEKHIIVQIPLKWNDSLQDEANIKKAKEAIWKVVKIEFKERKTEITPKDYAERKQIADKALTEIEQSNAIFSVTAKKYQDTYPNVVFTEDFVAWDDEFFQKYGLNVDELQTWLIDKVITTKADSVQVDFKDGQVISNWWEWYAIFYIKNIENKTIKEKKEDSEEEIEKTIKEIKFDKLFINAKPSEWKIALDEEGRALTDKYFTRATATKNQAFQYQIELQFNDEWAKIFWDLSTRLLKKQIAIFVWGELITAPTVQTPILDGRAVITGGYDSKTARKTASDINAWVIPAPIYLTSERSIDSKLWLNSLNKLIFSWILWFALVFLFLIVVYRASGILAWIALFSYVTVVLAILKAGWSVMTLATIAWLVLSIWMAIDANILIFERIKDELNKWRNIVVATKNWFEKSWSAIWDTNFTWLIIAIILYIFWVNMIKWFGLTLMIWTIVSLFTVMYISKVMIYVLASKKNIKLKNFVGYKEDK